MFKLEPTARGTFHQYLAAISASFGVLSAASSYGWITPLLDDLVGPESAIPMTEDELSWVVSMISIGCLLSPLPSGILSNYFGRKIVLLSIAPIDIVSWLLVLYFPSVSMLMFARLMHGMVYGIGFTVAPIYLGEISSVASRGAITSLFYISFWLGLLVSYSAGPYFTYHTFTYFVLALNVPFVALFCWQPETPFYCLMVHKERRALKSLAWLRGNPAEAQLTEELEGIKRNLEEKRNSAGLMDILYSSVDRRSMIFLLFLTIIRITSGIAALIVYATKIFDIVPNKYIPSDLITILLGFVMLGGSCMGLYFSDSLGRRPLLLISCFGSFICQFLLATYYLYLFEISDTVLEFTWIAPVLILLYTAFCTAGIFPVGSAYTSEMFNSNTRSIASSIASIVNSIVSFVMLLVFEPSIEYLGAYSIFYINALCLLLGFIYFYALAPETKGKPFAQIMSELESKKRKAKTKEVVADAS